MAVNAQAKVDLKPVENEPLYKFAEMQIAMRASLLEAMEKIVGVQESQGLIRIALTRYFEDLVKRSPNLSKIRTIEELINASQRVERALGIRSEIKSHSPTRYTNIRYECPYLAYTKRQPLFCVSCKLLQETVIKVVLKTDAQVGLKKTLAGGDPCCEFTLTIK